jgi:hypothetical protein
MAPTTHHDQVRLELLGQGHDLQIHLPHPEVGPATVSPATFTRQDSLRSNSLDSSSICS